VSKTKSRHQCDGLEVSQVGRLISMLTRSICKSKSIYVCQFMKIYFNACSANCIRIMPNNHSGKDITTLNILLSGEVL